MKNHLKYLCLAGAFSLLTVAGCSTKDDEENMTPDPEPIPNENAVSFASQIKPIIEQNCTPCHVEGGDRTNYTMFANAKSNVDGILNRINRNQGDTGLMPNGGQKLSEDKINLIQKWKDDGLAE